MSYELITPLLLVLCLLLLIILLVRQTSLDHKQERDKLSQEHGLVNLGNRLLDELDAQHDEAAKSLYEANQSLMTTLSQMGQGQSTLLESMQRQVLLSTRNQEEKINDLRLENERQLTEMRKTVDDRLFGAGGIRGLSSGSERQHRLSAGGQQIPPGGLYPPDGRCPAG